MFQAKTSPENWLRDSRERERLEDWKRRSGERDTLRCGVDLELVRKSSGLGVVCREYSMAGVDEPFISINEGWESVYHTFLAQ